MKNIYLFLCLTFIFGISVKTTAQVAPSSDNLTHQWTFDDGTANDSKGTLNGTLEGNASISNNALNTASGGYVTLNGSDLAINSYSELSVEVWFTSVAGANGSFHMLYYFGDTNSSGNGENYTCVTPARGNDVSRAILQTGESSDVVDGPEYDDGLLHHMVCVINATAITFYIDGVNMGAVDLTGTNSLSSIGTQFAYFAKGGYNADPTWKGSMHKISIYDTALTDENVAYLYQHGAEDNSVIASSVSSLAFDTNYPAQMITVTGSNLSSVIAITAPAGITVEPTTLPADALNADLTVVYDGSTPVDGNVTLTSGTTVTNIPIKCVSDAECFVPLYPDNINLITDPGMNDLSAYTGWGTREVVNIISDPANVYCGASSIKVGDGEKGGSGSNDFKLDDMLLPNTTYRVKVVGKTEGPFQLGIERIDPNHSANNNIFTTINTNGEWQTLDFTFATGDEIGVNPVIYLNDFQLSGTVGYFDNWELYAVPDPIITPTISSLAFDADYTEGSFNVTASNLSEDIAITAPAGITVSPSTLPAGAASALVTVIYDGTTSVDGNLTMTSGTATASVYLKSAGKNTDCFTPLYTDRTNLIPDPYFNDKSNFNGWKNWSLISIINNPDSVYCGSHTCRISTAGDVEVPLTDKLEPNYTYISRAMVRTLDGAFKMGINGHDVNFSGDFTDSINTDGAWQEFVFEFNTGESLMSTTPVIFFNNDGVSGKNAFIDNWELYQKEPYVTALKNVKDKIENIYVQDGKIVVEFDLDNSSVVELSVYNVQGVLISHDKMVGIAGWNKKVVDVNLASGIYIVKLTQNNESSYSKLIK